MKARADSIAMVEAAYVLQGDDRSWLQGIVDVMQAMIRAPMGCLAYHGTFAPLHLQTAVQSGGEWDMVAALQSAAEDPAYGTAITSLRMPVERMLMSEMMPPEHLQLGLLPGGAQAGMADALNLRAHHLDDRGTTVLGAGYSEVHSMKPAERTRWLMLAAHVKSGFRLRARLHEEDRLASIDPAEDEAVINPEGSVIHANGEARSEEALLRLREAAKSVDAARTGGGRQHADALLAWQVLILGKWSIVDRFDSDGRRFLVAHRNAPDVAEPRKLTPREACVAAYASQGLTNKLIAYYLGIGESAVSTHLSAVLRKLGLSTRTELVSMLGWIPMDPLLTDLL